MIIPMDTIAAISTPAGTGGIHVLRVSGKNSIEIVNQFFDGKDLIKAKSRNAYFGRFLDLESRFVDEVLITVFRAPNSYTGENTVEISCHGNYFIANQILKTLLAKARMANPGEFTQRAFLNQKMDLTQAEAVNDLLLAKTKKAQDLALQQLEGKLYLHIKELLTELKEYRATLELEIDFVEQGLDSLKPYDFAKELAKYSDKLQKLLKSGEEGVILREGIRIALVGSPNVGKSSIFNAMLESERAIVTPVPGTTRDYLEEAFAMQGYLIRLFDTAGIRETDDHVEKIGIDRSKDVIEKAHKVLFVNDKPEIPEDFSTLFKIIDNSKIMKVVNKIDLLDDNSILQAKESGFITCSTIKENGLKNLKEALIHDFTISEKELESGILTNTRQISAVQNSLTSIEKSIIALENDMGYEFAAFDLKEASEFLEEIIGKITSDDLLNHIFDNFCIGK